MAAKLFVQLTLSATSETFSVTVLYAGCVACMKRRAATSDGFDERKTRVKTMVLV